MKKLLVSLFLALLSAPVFAGTFDATVSVTSTAVNHTGYRYYRRLQAGGTYAVVGQTAPNVTSFVDTGLLESTGYCYQVGAFNSVNEIKSAEACGTTGIVVVPVTGTVSSPIIIYTPKP